MSMRKIAITAIVFNLYFTLYSGNPIEKNTNVCTTKACMNAGI